MSQPKPRRKRERLPAAPVPELKREASRLIAEGRMPTFTELLRAMRETKKELTIPVTEVVQ